MVEDDGNDMTQIISGYGMLESTQIDDNLMSEHIVKRKEILISEDRDEGENDCEVIWRWLGKSIKTTKQDLCNLEAKHTELQDMLSIISEEKAALSVANLSLIQEKENLDRNISTIISNSSESEKKYDDLLHRYTELKKAHDMSESRNALINSKLEFASSEIDRMKKETALNNDVVSNYVKRISDLEASAHDQSNNHTTAVIALKSERDGAISEKDAMNESIKTIKLELDSLRSQLRETVNEREVSDYNKKRLDLKVEEVINLLEIEKSRARTLDEDLILERKHCSDLQMKLNETIASKDLRISHLDKDNATLKLEIDTITEQLNAENKKLTATGIELNTVKLQLSEAVVCRDDLFKNVQVLKNNHKLEIINISRERDSLSVQLENANKRLETLCSEKAELVVLNSNLNEEVENMKSQLETERKRADTTAKMLAESESKLTNTRSELGEKLKQEQREFADRTNINKKRSTGDRDETCKLPALDLFSEISPEERPAESKRQKKSHIDNSGDNRFFLRNTDSDQCIEIPCGEFVFGRGAKFGISDVLISRKHLSLIIDQEKKRVQIKRNGTNPVYFKRLNNPQSLRVKSDGDYYLFAGDSVILLGKENRKFEFKIEINNSTSRHEDMVRVEGTDNDQSIENSRVVL